MSRYYLNLPDGFPLDAMSGIHTPKAVSGNLLAGVRHLEEPAALIQGPACHLLVSVLGAEVRHLLRGQPLGLLVVRLLLTNRLWFIGAEVLGLPRG